MNPRASEAPWWDGTSVYQVYPRSFRDSDGDGIGDLAGVTQGMDYIRALGVETVWLSPFYKSPQRDFGYDITDYTDVAPEYGSRADADKLVEAAHGRGLRVLFDLVLNHTSDEHPWFRASRASRTNPYADWYIWRDGRRDSPPNNWRSALEFGRAWQYEPARGQWYLASFLPFQPDLNVRNPAVREALFDVVRFWLARGVDGFRLDLFSSVMKDAEFRDNPLRPGVGADGVPRVFRPVHTLNTDDNFAFARALRAVCREFDAPERVLLGEVFGTPDVLRRYGGQGDARDGLQLVFLFDALTCAYGARPFRALIAGFEAAFPAPAVPTYVLENHDRARSLSRLGGDLRRARVLAVLLATVRGVATVYQGQELGLGNAYIPLARAQDPIARTYFAWLPEWLSRRLPERINRDEVRTPMPWTAGPHGGFCPAGVTPWLPAHPDAATRNVALAERDPDSLLALYRRAFALRRELGALRWGALRLDASAPRDVLAYVRQAGDAQVRVYLNMSDRAQRVALPARLEALLASEPATGVVGATLWMAPQSAAVLGAATTAAAAGTRPK